MRSEALSNISRWSTRLTSVAFALVGLTLFLAPDWAAANFAWSISPFVAMTMGGWYLGSAFLAWDSARLWRWSLVYPTLIVLWTFALMEAAVLIVHASALQPNALLLPYVLMLFVAVVTAVKGIFDWVRLRPAISAEGAEAPRWVRVLIVVFAAFVSYLAIPLLLGLARGGTVWPGTLTLLTARAFGAFYLALVLGVLPLIWARGLGPITTYIRAGLALILVITLAAVVFIREFDFAAKPGGLVYFGAYLIATVSAFAILGYRYLRARQMRARTAEEEGRGYAAR